MHPATRATTVAAMRSQSPLSSFLSSLLIEDHHGSTSTPTNNNAVVADNALSHGALLPSTRNADRATPLSLPDSASTAVTTSSSLLSRWDPSASAPVNRTSDQVHRKKRGARGSRSVSFWTSSDVPALPVRCDSPQVPRKHATTAEQQRLAKEFNYHHRYNAPSSLAANSASSIGSASGCVYTTASPRTALPPPQTTSFLPSNLFLLEETISPFPEQTRGAEAERIPRSTRLLSHQRASRSSIRASRRSSLSQTLLSCDSDTIDCTPPPLPIRQVSRSLYETIEPSSSSRCGDSSDTFDCAAAVPPVQPIRQVSRALYDSPIEASTELIC